jgi:hypothetical protein
MSRLEQRLNWARNQVGVSAGAPLAEVRSRFYAAVARENFVPEEALDRAFRTLRWDAEGVIEAEDPPEFLQAEECELDDAVEAFAAKMFSWPVAERRQRWAELCGRCEYAPRLRARLDRLAPGLDVELRPLDASGRQMHVETLGRYAAELFPMRPTARATRRHAILTALHKEEIRTWRKAAKSLKSEHSKLAALAPDLVEQVAAAGIPHRGLSKVTVQTEKSPHRGTRWGLAVAACILISFFIRAGLISTNSSSRPQNQNLPVDVQRTFEQLRQQPQLREPLSPRSADAMPDRFVPRTLPGENFRPPNSARDELERIRRELESATAPPRTQRPDTGRVDPWSRPSPYRPPPSGPPGTFPQPSSVAPPSPFPSGF